MYELEYTDDIRERILMRAYALYLKVPGVRKALDGIPHEYKFKSFVLQKLREVSDTCIATKRTAPEDVLSEYLKAGGLESPLTKVLNDEDYRFENLPLGILQNTVDHFVAAQLTADVDEITEDYRLGRITRSEYTYSIKTISDGEDTTPFVKHMAEVHHRLDGMEIPPGVKATDPLLHDRLKGFRRGRVTVMASRPGVGKTDFSLHVARIALANGMRVFNASLEMDETEIDRRLISAVGKSELENALSDGVFDICDRSSISVPQIASVADNYDLIIVDYLQILETAQQSNGLYEKATTLSNELRIAAKNSSAAWLVLSQLSRKSVSEFECPKLSHLRDSGAIEQDAYAVLFLHYPEQFVEDDSGNFAPNRYVQITVAKNRGGGTGRFAYRFCPAYCTWQPMTVDEVGSFEKDEKDGMNAEYNQSWLK